MQITSDGYEAYRTAVRKAFGSDVDYAMLIKEYATPVEGTVRYSPPICVAARQSVITGNPDETCINTSFVERQNLSMRMGMRRFTRLTNGFSKLLDNHKHMIALYYFNYNFIRKHQTVKRTPAVAAGIADEAWSMADFVRLMEREEDRIGGRISDYKPAKPSKNL